MTEGYYKNAMGIVLSYDCTSEQSFRNIRHWLKQIDKHAKKDVIKILIGNKEDMIDQKVVDEAEGRSLAQEYGISFFETSAKSGKNLDDVFYTLSKEILEQKLSK